MKKILILGASEFQIPLVQQARKMGFYVVIVDWNSSAPAIEFADEYYQCSLKDVQGVLEIAQKVLPDCVSVGMCDVAVPAAAVVNKCLGLSGYSVQVAELATNKFKMIERFAKYHVPHPAYRLLHKEEICSDVKVDILFPLIVKPVDMAGSRGINLVNGESQLYDALINSSSVSDTGDILIEEYMQGKEVSVELLVLGDTPHVLQITDKITSGAPHFMEIGHVQPSQFSADMCQQIGKVACDAAMALGLSNTMAHAEIMVTQQGPKMVELGARMGGDGIQQYLLEYSTGINLQEVVINLAMGESVELPLPRFRKGSAIRFITSQKGVLGRVFGVDQAEKIPGVQLVKIYRHEGDVFGEAQDNSGRIGYVIAQANSPDEALGICDRALDCIHVEWK